MKNKIIALIILLQIFMVKAFSECKTCGGSGGCQCSTYIEMENQKTDDEINSIYNQTRNYDSETVGIEYFQKALSVAYVEKTSAIKSFFSNIINNISTAVRTFIYGRKESETAESSNNKDEAELKDDEKKRQELNDTNIKMEATPPLVVGDPVLIGNGAYYTTSSDDGFSYGLNSFDISRRFITGVKPGGAFGESWSCSLDTRILRGCPEMNSVYVSKLQIYRTQLLRLQTKLLAVKDKTRPKYAKTEQSLNKKLSDCNTLLEQLKNEARKIENNVEANKYVSYGAGKELSEATSADWLVYISENGDSIFFKYNDAKKRYEEATGKFKELIYITFTDNEFCVCYKNGMKKVFNEYGLPLFFSDRYGSRIDFIYDESMKITSVECNQKNVLEFTWNENRITEIKNLRTQKKNVYAYENDFLVSYTDDAGNVYGFSYDDEGDVYALTKPDGSISMVVYGKIEYTPIDIRKVVLEHIDEENYRETYDYDLHKRTVIYTDADGVSTLYKYDHKSQVTEQVNADGTSIKWNYSSYTVPVSYTDYFGSITYTYDGENRLIAAKEQNSLKEEWKYEGAFGQLSYYKNKDGTETEYFYGANGDLQKITRDGICILTEEHNSWGGISSQNAFGKNYKYTYDEEYNLISDSNSEYHYDSRNRLSECIRVTGERQKYDYNGYFEHSITNSTGLKITYRWNNRNDITSVLTEDLNTGKKLYREMTYDKRHNITKIYEGTGNTQEEIIKSLYLTTEYSYTPGNLVESVIKWNRGSAAVKDAPGIKTDYSYDENKEICEQKKYFIDEQKNKTGAEEIISMETSYAGGLRKKQFFINGNLSHTQWFDRNNVLQKKEDAVGRTEEYIYSPQGFLLQKKNYLGGKEFMTYNRAAGLTDSYADENGNVSFIEYYSDGRVKKTIAADGFETEYVYSDNEDSRTVIESTDRGSTVSEYDRNGNLVMVEIKDKSGEVLVTKHMQYSSDGKSGKFTNDKISIDYEYDYFGRCVFDSSTQLHSVYDLNGYLVETYEMKGNKKVSTFYEYNAFGSISRVKEPNGNEINYYYDCSNRIHRITDKAGIIWEGIYDSRGRLWMEDGRLSVLKEYLYDDAGNKIEEKEAGVTVKKISYDDNFHKITFTDANCQSWVEEYDNYGNLMSRTNRLGKKMTVKSSDAGNVRETVDFAGRKKILSQDRMRGTCSIEYDSGEKDLIEYNAAENIVRLHNDYSSENFSYNRMQTVKNQTVAEKKYSYTYTSSGKLNTVTGNGVVNFYKYYDNGKIKQSGCNDVKMNYLYDEYGKETENYSSSGVENFTEYDAAGRPVLIWQKDKKNVLHFAEGYVYDDKGRISCTTDSTGNITVYEYDQRGRIARISMPYTKRIEADVKKELLEYEEKINSKITLAKVSISSDLYKKLRTFWTRLKITKPLALSSQQFWIETFTYDNNGNRLTRTTPAGTINYFYDREDRIVKQGKMTFTYDDNGNLIRRDSKYNTLECEYNDNNRLVKAVLYNKQKKRADCYTFTYDALGRRITSRRNNDKILRTVYMGFTLTKLTEYSCDAKTPAECDKVLSDQKDYEGRTNYLFTGNVLRAQTTDNDSQIMCVDQRGSVRSVCNNSGVWKCLVDYETSGKPLIQTDDSALNNWTSAETITMQGLDNLYCSKEYNSVLGMYNYGYRDYSLASSGFTTRDPVRDGNNWYSYCNGDWINFLDPDGREIGPITTVNLMNEGEWMEEQLGNGVCEYKMRSAGCAVTAVANAIASSVDESVTPHDINADKTLHTTENYDAIIHDEVKKKYNLDFEFYNEKTDFVKTLNKFNSDTDKMHYPIGQVRYSKDANGNHYHFVNIVGVTTIKDKVYLEISPTSVSDKSKTNRRLDTWMMQEGKMYVEASELIGIRDYIVKKAIPADPCSK